MKQSAQDVTEKLLDLAGVTATVAAEESEDISKIIITTEENALLIGKHGNTLESFEYILTQLINNGSEEFRRVTVEVGGYRKEREEYLKGLAERSRSDVLESGSEKILRGLKPWERRVVHLYLSEFPDIQTESTGEGLDRSLIIKRK